MKHRNRIIIAALSGGLAAGLAFATAAMMPAPLHANDGPRMSGMKISGLAGLHVQDNRGADVGHVTRIETDPQGRTRYVRVALAGGGEVRIAAFRAFYDRKHQRISLAVPLVAVLNDPGAQVDQAPRLDIADATIHPSG